MTSDDLDVPAARRCVDGQAVPLGGGRPVAHRGGRIVRLVPMIRHSGLRHEDRPPDPVQNTPLRSAVAG